LDEVFGDDDVEALNAAEDDDRSGHYDETAEMCLVEPGVYSEGSEADTKVEVPTKKKAAPKK
jgi:hypothetical protein